MPVSAEACFSVPDSLREAESFPVMEVLPEGLLFSDTETHPPFTDAASEIRTSKNSFTMILHYSTACQIRTAAAEEDLY